MKDEPEYADAIDCMVSYLYGGGYDASKYDTSEALLHAQVAIVADKYDYTSLYKLAKISFAGSIQAVESDEWRTIVAFYTNLRRRYNDRVCTQVIRVIVGGLLK